MDEIRGTKFWWLDHTIQFKNTGIDKAFTVLVADTMPAFMDLGTFEQDVGCIHSWWASSRAMGGMEVRRDRPA